MFIGDPVEDMDGNELFVEQIERDDTGVVSAIVVTFPPDKNGFYRAAFRYRQHGWFENGNRGTLFLRY